MRCVGVAEVEGVEKLKLNYNRRVTEKKQEGYTEEAEGLQEEAEATDTKSQKFRRPSRRISAESK